MSPIRVRARPEAHSAARPDASGRAPARPSNARRRSLYAARPSSVPVQRQPLPGTAAPTAAPKSGTVVAGPRATTAPAAAAPPAPTSLESAGSLATFTAAALAIKQNWSTFPSADARGAALGQAAADTLTAVNVHRLLPTLMADLPQGNNGAFDFRTWTLTLSRLPLAPAAPSAAAFDSAAATAYHEARHCEQWYRMARLRAGAGRTAAQISTEMDIPPAVALDAVGRPIAPHTADAAEAQVWWDSVYGIHATARSATLDAVLMALDAVNAANTADPSQTGAVAVATAAAFNVAYAAYRALPEEADAFATEDNLRITMAATAMLGSHPRAAPPPASPPTPPPSGSAH